MRTLRLNLAATAAICHRDLLMYLSYRARLVSHIFAVLVSLTLFYYISRLVRVSQFNSSHRYFSYVVVGIIIAGILQAALGVASTLRSELLMGTFERFVCSPFGAVNGIVSMVLFPVLLELVFSILTIALGSAIFGMPITWSTAPLAIPVALAGGALFSTLGLLFSAAVLVAKQTTAAATYATTALGLFGGIYFPIALLPSWGQFIAKIQPLTYTVALMRHYLIGYPMQGTVVGAVLRIAAFLIVGLPIAYILLARGVRFSRRRATVLEY
jgi:ABC-2 type transport system permease protein